MALTFPTATRNALASAIATLVDAQAGAGKIRLKDGSTYCCDITFETTAFGAPSTGVITGASFPKSANATAAGDLDNFEVTDAANTVVYSGTVTATGGGGDCTVDNVSVTVGQQVTVNSITYTQPA